MPPESQPQRPAILVDYAHESQPDLIKLAWSGSNVEMHLGHVRHDLPSGQNVERVSARVILHPSLAANLHQQLGALLGQLFPPSALAQTPAKADQAD